MNFLAYINKNIQINTIELIPYVQTQYQTIKPINEPFIVLGVYIDGLRSIVTIQNDLNSYNNYNQQYIINSDKLIDNSEYKIFNAPSENLTYTFVNFLNTPVPTIQQPLSKSFTKIYGFLNNNTLPRIQIDYDIEKDNFFYKLFIADQPIIQLPLSPSYNEIITNGLKINYLNSSQSASLIIYPTLLYYIEVTDNVYSNDITFLNSLHLTVEILS